VSTSGDESVTRSSTVGNVGGRPYVEIHHLGVGDRAGRDQVRDQRVVVRGEVTTPLSPAVGQRSQISDRVLA
jgi:hypothetical protein